MSLTVKAIYEDGVLKPMQSIALPDGTQVSVVITPTETTSTDTAEILAAIAVPLEDLDSETNDWLAADLTEDLLPYDWGEQGTPPGKSVKYVPGTGFVVEGGKSIA